MFLGTRWNRSDEEKQKNGNEAKSVNHDGFPAKVVGTKDGSI